MPNEKQYKRSSNQKTLRSPRTPLRFGIQILDAKFQSETRTILLKSVEVS